MSSLSSLVHKYYCWWSQRRGWSTPSPRPSCSRLSQRPRAKILSRYALHSVARFSWEWRNTNSGGPRPASMHPSPTKATRTASTIQTKSTRPKKPQTATCSSSKVGACRRTTCPPTTCPTSDRSTHHRRSRMVTHRVVDNTCRLLACRTPSTSHRIQYGHRLVASLSYLPTSQLRLLRRSGVCLA